MSKNSPGEDGYERARFEVARVVLKVFEGFERAQVILKGVRGFERARLHAAPLRPSKINRA
jgi:hypothetical protein